MKVKSISLIVLLVLGAAACQYEEVQSPQEAPSPMDEYAGDEMATKKSASTSNAVLLTPEFLDAINHPINKVAEFF